MNDLSKEEIARRVQDHLRDRRPGGVRLKVVEAGIRKVDHWWRVPVRPSALPARLFEYYEALAEVEAELQENERLNVVLATGEPQETTTQPEQTPAKAG